ncbi:rhamnan synthesis F family protein [Sphingomonas mucosissima]|uniref:N-acetylglucosaminyl-diphospho-decaprenol L-rhamnosyltransferase n=1 Tax=Sphingomonas mucosissima TaxID=370959 RepID=A0A245ZT51_9SPHN|nr:rhamnan synthesis F family protein [Sphingomonas mucosissima]OWK32928.1 N-acetylglucosaminyl-diphospho-decaprenol L-rhamnosyltransferase [Sphingomonas mucosissima]
MGQSYFARAVAALGLAGDSSSPRAKHRLLGDKARDAGSWAVAAEHYRSYLDANPTSFAIWVQLGHALKEAGELARAEEAYLQAERLYPGDSDLALNLGHLMKSMRRQSDAARYYARSFQIDGNRQACAELKSLGISPERDLATGGSRIGQSAVGSIDKVEGLVVRGWAVEPDPADGPAEIEIVGPAGRIIGSGIAAQFRSDVAQARYTGGPAGFTILVDAAGLSGDALHANVRLRSTGELLDGSPVTITLPRSAEAGAARHITAVRYVTPKPLSLVSGEHAIYVAYAATGMLQPFVRRFLRMLREQGISVSLVVNTDRPVALDDEVLGSVSNAIVRENKGYDFGAWAHMLRLEPRLYDAECLYIINDSIVGPSNEAAFTEVISRVRQNTADLVSLTETLERGWHLQSYFLRASGQLLKSYAFQLFVNAVSVVADKDAIINEFEVPLAQGVHRAGFTVDSIFKVDEARNPTLFAWKRLLASGFPFIKRSLLHNTFEHVNTERLTRELKRAGFDLQMIEASRDYGTDEPIPAAGFPLLARPVPDSVDMDVPAKPYKVAFYGPWNYDNGLGAASRGIIAAIRHAGVRLNLHPIRKPFHVHKPLVPAHDVIDFDGVADVAIVHLNPDSWHLLTEEQRAQISRAGRRIGYWVWEMEQLPAAWEHEFSSVDRIWAPSSYNANVFAAAREAPVDVIPHVVPVRSDGTSDTSSIRSALGLPTDRRLVLYVFDGASYLVRKNPAALLQAFAASGLAARGWSLVLKTKHLMDRPGDGQALAALAEVTAGVILLDRSLSSHELADLVASCDIYASPHCSEGFGLTVAEAMAAGRIVVATDYSGTTQFLDGSCGFPVPADPWTLDEDFGHYFRGGTWARIDQAALADALVAAADHVNSGDGTIGDAARTRVAQSLSVEAVGAAIAASLEAVLSSGEPVRRTMPKIEDAGAGVPLSNLRLAEAGKLKVMSLKPGSMTPLGDGLGNVPNDQDAWLMIVPDEGRVHPLTGSIVDRLAVARPDVALCYADDVAYGEATLLEQIRLKPQFDRTLFAAQDYIGAPLFIRGSALHEIGGLRVDLGDAALFDLVLRIAEHGLSIASISEVILVQGGQRLTAPVAERRAILERSPLYAGYSVTEGQAAGSLQLSARWSADLPSVTLCIPTRRTPVEGSEGTYIERLLKSLADVEWPADRLTVLVGDDLPGTPSWAAQDWPFLLRRIETPRAPDEPFNFAAKMNLLWRAAPSDLIVMLNDDVFARKQDWLRALLSFAVDRDVGAVGARLLYDDGTVQHAGIYGGVLGTCVHAWLGLDAATPTYQDWGVTQREVSMVTGAVLATRRSVLEAVGGFDERFSLEFNDIDLCLKIRQQGLRIVYNPAAELIHSEKKSRGASVPPGEQLALFLTRWQHWLADDPALPPHMRRDMLDLTPSAGAGDWFV